MTDLIAPYGGELRELYLIDSLAAALKAQSRDWPSWDLTPRQMCDIELLLNGAFSPLGGFMCRREYEPVVRDMRLADGTLWPIPITLDITQAAKEHVIKLGYDQAYGARPLRRTIQNLIEDPLAEHLLLGRYNLGDTIVVDLDPDGNGLSIAATEAKTPVEA